MKKLTPEYWKLFKKDGVLFEKLTGQILIAQYPDIKFDHTGGPYDGGKDFEAYICEPQKRIEFWAECKYHKDPLPIHDVSMSMTMAVIEKVNKIIFFSYSPVNRNFNKYIAKYKKSTQKQVEVYSDCELESLIFSVKDDIDFNSFFPEYDCCTDIENVERGLKTSYILQRNQSRRIPKKVQVNDIITTELYLTNNSDNEIHTNILLIKEKSQDYLQCIDHTLPESNFKINIDIPAHSTEMAIFPFRIVNYIDKIKLPPVEITINGIEHITKNISKNLHCIWLAETKLIGKQYIDYLSKCSDLLLSGKNMTFLTLSGQSGCGKSRLLTELKCACTSYGRKVIEIDSDKKILNAKAFVQQIVSHFEELPIFSYKMYKKINHIIHERNTEKTYAMHILYDESFNPMQEQDLLIKYLYSLLKVKHGFLLLDNVQNYDETIIEIIEGIIDLSYKDNNNSGIAFSFNNDFLYKDTKPYYLLRRLKAMYSTHPDSVYYEEIKGFSKSEAIQYLNECLKPELLDDTDKIEYNRCLEKIIENHGSNPFYLKNYVLYLYQNNIIKRNTFTGFYICDIIGFQNRLKDIPDSVYALIEERESIMLRTLFKNQAQRDEYYKFISLLAFLKIMPMSLYREIIADSNIKENMEQLGFIKTDLNGDIICGHDYYYRFFINKYPYSTLNDELLSEFLDKAQKLYLSEKMKCQIFIAKYLTGRLKNADIEKIISNIIVSDIDYDFSKVVFDAVCAILYDKPEFVDIGKYIEIYKGITTMSLNRFGIENSLKYHENIYKEFIHNPLQFKDNLLNVAPVLFEHITHLMGQTYTQKSLEINTQIINVLNKHFSQNIEYNGIMARLYNFQTNAYNQLNMFENAISANQQALNYAEQTPDKSALITTLKNKGDIYYALENSYEYCDKMVECWSNAFNMYVKYYENIESKDINLSLKLTVYIKGALSDMLLGDLKNAEKKISCLNKYLNRTDMMYFEEKLRLIIAEYYIISHKVDDYSINLIKQAVDICALYGNRNSYMDCFYMLAVAYMFLENYDFSYENYYKAYSVIIPIIDNDAQTRYFSYFFIDMVIALRRMNKQHLIAQDSILLPVCNHELQEKIDYILKLNDIEFSDYLKQHGRVTPLYDKQYFLNFPKI